MSQIGKLLEPLLDRVAAALKDRQNPAGEFQRWLRRFCRLLAGLTIAYLAALCLVLFLLEYAGETGIVLSLLLYLPPWGWLLPLLGLTPLCLAFRARLCLLHLAALVLVLGVYMDCRISSHRPGPGLKVFSYNYGQRDRTSMSGFAEQEQPDIIALQEAPDRQGKYSQIYPDRTVLGVGEFLLISRYPVLAAEGVLEDPFNKRQAAVRFELDYDGRRIAVYNAHLPTVRKEVERLRGNGFLRGLFHGGGIYSAKERARYRDFLRCRRELAAKLAAMVRNEPLPCLLVGDLNTPAHGRVYRLVRAGMTDAFKEKGRGCGYTFPGSTSKFYTFGQPWLRLDYIFCSREWQVEYFRTEAKRKSQHRAIVARLTLQD